MKVFLSLLVLLVLVGGSAAGFFYYSKEKKDFSLATTATAGLLEIVQKVAPESLSRILFDRRVGSCVLVTKKVGSGELVEDRTGYFTYGTPVKLQSSGLLCNFNIPGSYLFVGNRGNALISVHREVDMPAIIELHEGAMSISSNALGVVVKNHGQRIVISSANETMLLVDYIDDTLNFSPQKGDLSLEFRADPGKSTLTKPINMLVSPEMKTTMQVKGHGPITPGKSAQWLPSGLQYLD